MDGSETENITNNLNSVSEDGVNVIENTTVYADNDYITLSDILPTSHDADSAEIPNSFDDMLLDGEVLSTPVLHDMTTSTEIPSENQDLTELVTYSTAESQSPVTSTLPEAAKKRGRKKVVVDNTTSLTEAITPQPTDLPSSRPKRERKRNSRLSEPATPAPKKAKTPRSSKKQNNIAKDLSEPPAELTAEIDEPKAKVKKRGKKSKIINRTIPADEEVSNIVKEDDFTDLDDICLSSLKQNDNGIGNDSQTELIFEPIDPALIQDHLDALPTHGITPVLSDFECNQDKVIAETSNIVVEAVGDADVKNITAWNSIETKPDSNGASGVNGDENHSLLVEDNSKRPTRRKALNKRYEVDSDEDPFANVQLSDDEKPRKRTKTTRYYSDDEYVPEDAEKKITSEEDIESDFELDSESGRKPKRKSLKSPGKRKQARKSSNTNPKEESTDVVKPMEDEVSTTSTDARFPTCNRAFEDFLAQRMKGTALKIKKVTSKETEQSAPLEIPVLEPNEPKKTLDKDTQTITAKTSSQLIQTSTPYALKITKSIDFKANQSESACEFLKNILTSTSELGKLMTDKSEEFMQKKINTDHVKDTVKMDYCIKKAFLLLKLAKDNLSTMEENLEKQYEEFLRKNDLTEAIETEKKIVPKVTKPESDSDCEIIEEPVKKPVKAKFNPKTVFLNKELSIKIAKKAGPAAPQVSKFLKKEPPIIKEKNSVWINEGIILKKVKAPQSFLAQDGRNKKPPDCITEKMVKNFFDDYHAGNALSMCSQLTSPYWLSFHKPAELICNYFVVSASNDNPSGTSSGNSPLLNETTTPPSEDEGLNCEFEKTTLKTVSLETTPKKLFSLCTESLRNILFQLESNKTNRTIKRNGVKKENISLFNLCLSKISNVMTQDSQDNDIVEYINHNAEEPTTPWNNSHIAVTLKQLYQVPQLKKLVRELINIYVNDITGTDKPVKSKNDKHLFQQLNQVPQLKTLVREFINIDANKPVESENAEQLFEQIHEVPQLKSLCVKLVSKLLRISEDFESNLEDFVESLSEKSDDELFHCYDSKFYDERMNESDKTRINNDNPTVKSLQQIVLEKIKSVINGDIRIHNFDVNNGIINKVMTLSGLSLAALKYSFTPELFESDCYDMPSNILTIGTVNTMSEEAFHSIDDPSAEAGPQSEGDDYYGDDNFDVGEDDGLEEDDPDNNWVSQLQLQELKCGILINLQKDKGNQPTESCEEPFHVQIKSEILDEPECPPVIEVKKEPEEHCNNMVVIPEHVVTKSEYLSHTEDAERYQQCNSVDMNSFESFVSNNKLMHGSYENSEIFSQSNSRVRRQYDPDSDNESENFNDMSLLVPHASEVHAETAKGSLMESSSDENSKKQKSQDKKTERKKKSRPKKVTPEVKETLTKTMSKDTKNANKESPLPSSDLAILTRKMKERLRSEEKKNESSDSETENVGMITRGKKGKDKKDKAPTNKTLQDEIQCNNVDSTQQVDNTKSPQLSIDSLQNFSGFSTVDQNETAKYQKYLKFVYDKILPKEGEEVVDQENAVIPDTVDEPTQEDDDNDRHSPLMMTDEPVELLECEPTMPVFEKPERRTKEKTNKKSKASIEKSPNDAIPTSETGKQNSETEKQNENGTVEKEQLFVDRHGWQCYPIPPEDVKLNLSIAYIGLEKLPEEFVQMYFKYQNITMKSKEDLEIEKLSNLNSLHRAQIANEVPMETGKVKNKRVRIEGQKDSIPGNVDESGAANSDHYFTASEDETPDVNTEDLPAPVVQSAENCLAKNSLMDDNESDSEIAADGTKIKKEFRDDAKGSKEDKNNMKKERTIKIVDHPKSLVLTADKMMKKELEQLHAPVNLDEPQDIKPSPPKNLNVKTSEESRKSKRQNRRVRTKSGDDYSSEEEKQWVCTKSKLLKRMEKKIETSASDDAKRAKLVSEYIERKSDNTAGARKRGRSRRSMKKFLEKEKQLRVLQQELYGDGQMVGKSSHTSYSKGRKNIRKVIDKKSLQKKTVIANMEEFERKRRLNQKQTQLRQLLDIDEGVNVVVVDDEVCLEYDFEQNRPIVTIHPFFTKVMKAHQYEGVKFMWDACFESLEKVESGHPGSGCILAHCMGLGKTLQVLALLHAALTQPRLHVKRVLVCCPLSTVLNWVDEIHKWLGPVTDQIKVFELSKLKKTYERAYQLEDWYNGGGIFIIGYELFRSLSTLDPELDDVRPTIINKIRHALLDPGPDVIVCDEGHLLKNDCSVLAVAMSRVATKRRIVLTGTPMQNNLREYYCMVNFIKPSLLGTYAEYSNRFENPIMNGQHRDSQEEDIKLMKTRTHILHKVLEGCLQRQEASVLYPYLPTKREYTVFISLSACQIELYRHYLNNYAGNCSKVAKHNVLKDFHVLQKIWSHPRVLHNFQKRGREAGVSKVIKDEIREDDLAREDLTATEDVKPADTEVWWLEHLDGGDMLEALHSSTKFLVVFKILHECVELGDKLLIFSTSLYTMDALEYFLQKINKWSLGAEYYRLDGSVPPEVRQKWCREFNAEHNTKTKVFLISTRAGSLGLNLTAANRVIILDTSWNPAHDIQSIFRVYRFGQKKDCYIYRLVAMGTMEQKIYERAVTKQAVACRVVDEQQIDRHYNMAELTELYRFDVLGEGVAGGVAAGVRDVVLLRVARDTPALHAAYEHDSLLRDTREQDLPEHERAAAWNQFELEHQHKQMQQNQSKIPPIAKRTHEQQIKGQQWPLRVTADGAPEPGPRPGGGPEPGPAGGKRGRKKHKGHDAPNQIKESATEVLKKIQEALQKTLQEGLDPNDVAKIVSKVASNVQVVYKPYDKIQPDGDVQPKSKQIQEPSEGETTASCDEYIVDNDDCVPAHDDSDDEPLVVNSQNKSSNKAAAPVAEESIILSDDEVTPSKEKAIPLHASLLKNKNFIKIVAHTYLKGNPMLDEDAAMLAAEYSTSKAAREVAETGQSITSGPIYDIAINVLGKAVLVKLHEADKNKDQPAIAAPGPPQADTKPTPAELAALRSQAPSTSRAPALQPRGLQTPLLRVKSENSLTKTTQQPQSTKTPRIEAPIETVTPQTQELLQTTEKRGRGRPRNPFPPPQPEFPTGEKRGRGRPRKLLDEDSTELDEPTTPGYTVLQNSAVPANDCVVPVELIKNADHMSHVSSPFAAAEESILPDDDVCVLGDPTPAPAPAAAPRLLDILMHKKGSMTLYKTTTSTGEEIMRLGSTKGASGPRIMQIRKADLPPNVTPIVVRSAPTAPPLTPLSDGATICIDSDDDDEPAAPAPAPAPAPARRRPRGTAQPPPPATPVGEPVPVALNPAMFSINPNMQNKNFYIIPAGMMAQFPQQAATMSGQMMSGNSSVPFLTLDPASLMTSAAAPAPSPQPTEIASTPKLDGQALFKLIAPKPGPASKKVPVSKSESVSTTSLASKPGPASKAGLASKPGPASKTDLASKSGPVSKPGPGSKTGLATSKKELPPKPIDNPEPSGSRSRRISITSSSSSDEGSRPSSPADPLSVLQNVVHIAADQYEAPAPANDWTKPIDKAMQLLKAKKISTKSASSQDKPSPPPKIVNSEFTKPLKFTLPTSKKPLSKALEGRPGLTVTKKTPEPAPSTSNTITVKRTQKVKKPEGRLLGSFDLTEEPAPAKRKPAPAPAAAPATATASAKKTSSKIVDKSKNIIISSSGTMTKAPKNQPNANDKKNTMISSSGSKTKVAINQPNAKSQTSVKNQKSSNSMVFVTSSRPSQPATNKRKPAAAAPAEPPKKKPNKPMRLEDFSLDDIEDIIELE